MPPEPEPLPPPVEALAVELAALPGAVAVVLGGSRATGRAHPGSDWDLGLYFRGSARAVDPEDVRRLGHPGVVSELGEWGPIVNGGAWLSLDGLAVDVLFRDLDVVEGWWQDAREGRFAVLPQNGYLAGGPTYLPVGELACCRPLSGELPTPVFPEALAHAAPARWRGRAQVALMFAEGHAAEADAVCCAGMLALAVLAEGHARMAQRRAWVLNEKRLVRRAGLEPVEGLLAALGPDAAALRHTVRAVSATLGIDALRAR